MLLWCTSAGVVRDKRSLAAIHLKEPIRDNSDTGKVPISRSCDRGNPEGLPPIVHLEFQQMQASEGKQNRRNCHAFIHHICKTRVAEAARSSQHKSFFIEMAERWLTLAEHAEKTQAR